MLKFAYEKPLYVLLTISKGRSLHSCRPCRGSEDLDEISRLFQNNQTPADNYVKQADYVVPSGLFSAYRQQRRDPSVRFKDVAVVKLRSGDGGAGKVSFLRESGRAVGPPDGGDGGSGGHVYVQAVEGLNSLHHIRHIYKAQNGRGGGSTQLSGKNGENVILQVPVGTTVRWSPPLEELKAMNDELDEESKKIGRDLTFTVDQVMNYTRFDYDTAIQLHRESFTDGAGWIFKEKDEEYFQEQSYFKKIHHKVRYYDLISRRREREQDIFPVHGIDLSVPGEPVRLLIGGTGGMGNMHFQTGEVRNPRFAKMGRSGLESSFIFELRLIADLGLVGLPNAGKSSLLRAISRARPRVGHWEFTTLTPTIGTISMGISEPSFTVADIPGIIAGAHENRGLGLGFLRHIERSGGLVFVVALDRPDPAADLNILMKELGPERLEDKRILVVATKADLPEAQENYETFASYVGNLRDTKGRNYDLIPCSAQDNGNIEAVIQAMGKTSGKA